jgi:hypothetical protein
VLRQREPFADCTMATAMPRLRTKRRDRIGTKTTRPRQFAPSVITTPYSTITCHNVLANELAARPAASKAPPMRISRFGPSRSTRMPTSGEVAPLISCDTE